mmetsp:Transcript_37256/g.87281  ORF Transcript_37256/g.87281 Transcript_37256/m.87281 type:complete len:316 (+) Transcript_37256:1321-2268(+)
MHEHAEVPKVLRGLLHAIWSDQPCFELVRIQSLERSLRILSTRLLSLIRLARIDYSQGVRQLRPISNYKPASSRRTSNLSRIPSQPLAAGIVATDPPPLSYPIRVFAVVDAQHILHDLILLLIFHEPDDILQLRERASNFALAFTLLVLFPLNDFLVDRAVVGRDILGSYVAAVELWPRFGAGDVDHAPCGAFLVLLIISDDTQGIFQLLVGQIFLLVIVIVGNILQRTLVSRHTQVQPHPQQWHWCVSLHQHAQTTEESLHTYCRPRTYLEDLQGHADLHNSRALNALSQHSLQLLLLYEEAALQYCQCSSDAR